MANQLQLQRQIEEEMALDKRINKFFNKFLKQHKQFCQVQERQGYDLVLIVNEHFPLQINMISKEDYCNTEEYRESKFIFFLKYKNKHDSKLHINTFLTERNPFKNNGRVTPK